MDDHKLVSDGFSKLIQLNPLWKVVVSCASYQEAVEADLSNTTDLAIIDISLPDHSGFELIKLLRKQTGRPKIIVVSMYEHFHYVSEAIALEVEGYVSKAAATEELVEAIEDVLGGECYYSGQVAHNYQAFKTNNHSDPLHGLTNREWEIFKLLCLGLGPKRVSQRLNLMPKTVFTHRANIYRKLNLDNQFDLLKLALKMGAVELNELTAEELPRAK